MRLRYIIVLLLTYCIAAKLGLKFAFVHSDATAVWPPAGIALAALLLWGRRLWPGVFIGAFLAHVSAGDGISLSRALASIGIAAGDTLQGLLGASLVIRFAHGRLAFDRAADVFRFAILAAVASTVVGATCGVISLGLAGLVIWTNAPAIWMTRWIGHAAGVLVFAPPLILWGANPRLRWNRARGIEAGVLLLALSASALGAFTDVLPPGPSHLGLGFLCAPALLWAAFRFGQRETATAMLVLCGIAIWGVFHGLQAAEPSRMDMLLEVEAYLGVTSLTILAVAGEVSQRKRQERALGLQAKTLWQQAQMEQAARVEAERANRLKDEFLATVSHELRTPLTAVIGWARMLRRGGLEQSAREQALEVIERNARAQAKLIEEILDVSRIASGKLRLEIRVVDLPAIIDAAIETVHPAAEARGVRIEKVIDPDMGNVAGDPQRLQQVVWNLLANAVKFSPKGGWAEVQLHRRGSEAEIKVSDLGQGIGPEFLPHVFEPFRQADASPSRAQGGLGLGLTIVHRLVHLHGGTVDADSAGPGKGATFTVRLPLMPNGWHTAGRPLRGMPERACVLTSVRILLVEDEPDTRHFLTAALESYGAEVSAVASAREALDALDREERDVLVCDIGLPGDDGYTLVRRIREWGPAGGGDIPALALTAHARLEDRRQALAAGFQIHLTKPIDTERLAHAIEHLARSRLAVAARLR